MPFVVLPAVCLSADYANDIFIIYSMLIMLTNNSNADNSILLMIILINNFCYVDLGLILVMVIIKLFNVNNLIHVQYLFMLCPLYRTPLRCLSLLLLMPR